MTGPGAPPCCVPCQRPQKGAQAQGPDPWHLGKAVLSTLSIAYSCICYNDGQWATKKVEVCFILKYYYNAWHLKNGGKCHMLISIHIHSTRKTLDTIKNYY